MIEITIVSEYPINTIILKRTRFDVRCIWLHCDVKPTSKKRGEGDRFEVANTISPFVGKRTA